MRFDVAAQDCETVQDTGVIADGERRAPTIAPAVARAVASRGTRLTDLAVDATGSVLAVEAPVGAPHSDLPLRLAELGFLPGERVRLIARLPLGGPLAVRVGTGTFALRREEAACVRIAVRGEPP
jgi:ferrous iron transport protein A